MAAVGTRKLDVTTASMDIHSLNNVVVSLRNLMRKVKLYTIQKLVRQSRQLLQKKCSEDVALKKKKKAERLVSEIGTIKELNLDHIIKYALANTRTFDEVAAKGVLETRAKVRLATHTLMAKQVQKWRKEHEDWEALAAFMMYKNTGRRFKKKKKKDKTKVSSVNTKKVDSEADDGIGKTESTGCDQKDKGRKVWPLQKIGDGLSAKELARKAKTEQKELFIQKKAMQTSNEDNNMDPCKTDISENVSDDESESEEDEDSAHENSGKKEERHGALKGDKLEPKCQTKINTPKMLSEVENKCINTKDRIQIVQGDDSEEESEEESENESEEESEEQSDEEKDDTKINEENQKVKTGKGTENQEEESESSESSQSSQDESSNSLTSPKTDTLNVSNEACKSILTHKSKGDSDPSDVDSSDEDNSGIGITVTSIDPPDKIIQTDKKNIERTNSKDKVTNHDNVLTPSKKGKRIKEKHAPEMVSSAVKVKPKPKPIGYNAGKEMAIKKIDLNTISEDLEDIPLDIKLVPNSSFLFSSTEADIDKSKVKRKKKDAFFCLSDSEDSAAETTDVTIDKPNMRVDKDYDSDADNDMQRRSHHRKIESAFVDRLSNKQAKGDWGQGMGSFSRGGRDRGRGGRDRGRGGRDQGRGGTLSNCGRGSFSGHNSGYRPGRNQSEYDQGSSGLWNHDKQDANINKRKKPVADVEKLHPSWEAKRLKKEREGHIKAFQGTKIKFDD